MALAADLAQVDILGAGGLLETGDGALAGGDVGLDAAGADVDGLGVGRVPVRLDGRVLGLGEVVGDLVDLVGLGLSHGDGCVLGLFCSEKLYDKPWS